MHGSTCCCQSKKLESSRFYEIFTKAAEEGKGGGFSAIKDLQALDVILQLLRENKRKPKLKEDICLYCTWLMYKSLFL